MSVSQELERLTQLRDQGMLNESEFQEAKAKVLRGNGPGLNLASPSANQTAMLLHLSQYLGYMVPLLGFAAPILIWQLKKEDMPELDIHGRIVTNWMLSALIYYLISAVLMIVMVGFLGILLVGALSLIYPIIGGIKANDGEPWDYPGSIRFF